MTHNPTPPARIPFGTRTVRRVLGVDPIALLAPERCTDPAVTALAGHVLDAAVRADASDARLARDAARIADQLALLGDRPDGHIVFAWTDFAARAQRLAAAQRSFFADTEAVDSAVRTYARATAPHTPAPTADDNTTAHPPV